MLTPKVKQLHVNFNQITRLELVLLIDGSKEIAEDGKFKDYKLLTLHSNRYQVATDVYMLEYKQQHY